VTTESAKDRKPLLIAWTCSSLLLAAGALAWVCWHLLHPVAYSAEQIYAQAAMGLVLLLFVPALALAIVQVVESTREIREERRRRPEIDRQLDEATAELERLAREARERREAQLHKATTYLDDGDDGGKEAQ
jgi:TRAP-type C4-dicarboxylate transport system permease small subunit